MTSHTLNILLVDDEEIVRDTIGDYLTDCGHEVTHAEDGRQAVDLLGSADFDLVLADVRMPGIDGLALLSRIREDSSVTPVVMMTGHGDAEMDSEAERRGASGFLLKPVRLMELDDMIIKLVGEAAR